MQKRHCDKIFHVERLIKSIQNNETDKSLFEKKPFFEDASNLLDYFSLNKNKFLTLYSNIIHRNVPPIFPSDKETNSAHLAIREVYAFLSAVKLPGYEVKIEFESNRINREIDSKNNVNAGKWYLNGCKDIDKFEYIKRYHCEYESYIVCHTCNPCYSFNYKRCLLATGKYLECKKPTIEMFNSAISEVSSFYVFLQLAVNEHISNDFLISKKYRIADNCDFHNCLNIKESCSFLIEELECDIGSLSADIACNAHALAEYIAINYPKKQSWQKCNELFALLPELKINGLINSKTSILAYICAK